MVGSRFSLASCGSPGIPVTRPAAADSLTKPKDLTGSATGPSFPAISTLPNSSSAKGLRRALPVHLVVPGLALTVRRLSSASQLCDHCGSFSTAGLWGPGNQEVGPFLSRWWSADLDPFGLEPCDSQDRNGLCFDHLGPKRGGGEDTPPLSRVFPSSEVTLSPTQPK